MASFQDSLLSRFNAKTRKAQQKQTKQIEAAAASQREEKRQKEEQFKIKEKEALDKIVERNSFLGKLVRHTTTRSRSSRISSRSTSGNHTSSSTTRRGKRLTVSSKRKEESDGPPRPLPGMEFVVRKTRKKKTHVPHSSDYSDMFGSQYLQGAELPVTKNMVKDSAKALEENKKIHAEKKENVKRAQRQAAEDARRAADLKKRGLLTARERKRLQTEASSRDWVAVDAPVAVGKMGKAQVKQLSSESSVLRRVVAETAGDRAVKKVLDARVVRQKQKELLERIKNLGGGGGSAKTSASAGSGEVRKKKRARVEDDYEEEEEYERRRAVKVQRKRREDRQMRGKYEGDRSGRTGPFNHREKERPRVGGRSAPAERGYNSEEWSDGADDNDGDDGEDLFDISALDREEERTEKAAKFEDRREFLDDKKRRKEKERRREQHEVYGDESD